MTIPKSLETSIQHLFIAIWMAPLRWEHERSHHVSEYQVTAE